MDLDFSDVTFIIPLRIDNKERLENLGILLSFLSSNFQTNFIILEADSERKIKSTFPSNVSYIYKKDDSKLYHRTKYINEMLRLVKTPIVNVCDVDALTLVEGYFRSVMKIRNSSCQFSFPHNGNMKDVPRSILSDGRFKELDKTLLAKSNTFETIVHNCLGGTFFASTSAYKACGGENEHFISWGPEDQERIIRFEKLGYKVDYNKTETHMFFHLQHPRTENSSSANSMMQNNVLERHKVNAMSQAELVKYIRTWEWIPALVQSDFQRCFSK